MDAENAAEQTRAAHVADLRAKALEGVTLDDCAEMARKVGERVGRELQIPVFLYEAAASTPAADSLESASSVF